MGLSKHNPGDQRLLNALSDTLSLLTGCRLSSADVPTSLAEKVKAEIFAGTYKLDSPDYYSLRPFVMALCALRSIARTNNEPIRLGAARLLRVAANELARPAL